MSLVAVKNLLRTSQTEKDALAARVTVLEGGGGGVDLGPLTTRVTALENALGQGFTNGLMTPSGEQWGYSTVLLTAQRVYYGRFVVRRPTPVAKLGVVVTTVATQDDPIEVAIMDATGAKVFTTGLVAFGVNSITQPRKQAVVTAPGTLQPGVYYNAVDCPTVGGAAAATLLGVTAGTTAAFRTMADTIPDVLGGQENGKATVPSQMATTPTFSTGAAVVVPIYSS